MPLRRKLFDWMFPASVVAIIMTQVVSGVVLFQAVKDSAAREANGAAALHRLVTSAQRLNELMFSLSALTRSGSSFLRTRDARFLAESDAADAKLGGIVADLVTMMEQYLGERREDEQPDRVQFLQDIDAERTARAPSIALGRSGEWDLARAAAQPWRADRVGQIWGQVLQLRPFERDSFQRASVEASVAARRAWDLQMASYAFVLLSTLLSLGMAGWSWFRLRAVTRSEAMARLKAEAADTAKSSFLAAASHDLRQPLHAMNLYLATLKRRVTDPPTLRILSNITQSAAAMQRMLNGVLDVARIDAGVLQPNLEDLELQVVFDGLVASHRGVAKDKGLSLRAEPTPLLLWSDRVLLECVLGNLLSNAIKFTPTGGVVLAAVLEGDVLLLTVSDTGMGIPAESQDFIFGEFNRLYDAESPQLGLGLGLSIVRRVVALLRGSVSVASGAEGGSVFTIRLPYVAGTPLAPEPDLAAFTLQGIDLLLVDDDAEVLAAMAGELADLGATIRTARTGAEAVALAHSGPAPAAILSDFQLPDTGGIVLLRALRERYAHRVPALLISGSTDSASMQVLASSGDPWLAKPAAPAELVRALMALLATPQTTS